MWSNCWRFPLNVYVNLQQLDHIFVSKGLFDIQDDVFVRENDDFSWMEHVFVPHVNSMFSRDRHIQVSDHDPITARIKMTK